MIRIVKRLGEESELSTTKRGSTHAADLGYIPVVVTDACGAGHEEAARRSIASLEFAGDALMTDVDKPPSEQEVGC